MTNSKMVTEQGVTGSHYMCKFRDWGVSETLVISAHSASEEIHELVADMLFDQLQKLVPDLVVADLRMTIKLRMSRLVSKPQ